MKWMEKFLMLILFVFICTHFDSVMAQDDGPVVFQNNCEYAIDEVNETASLVKGDDVNSNVVIDSVVVYDGRKYPVTKIETAAFWYCDRLVNVTMPNSIVEIGNSVFQDCDKLKIVDVSDSIEIMGDNTFWGCTSLERTGIPGKITKIPDGTFGKCHSLHYIFSTSDIKVIGDQAFYECLTLGDYNVWYNMLETVDSIGFGAFQASNIQSKYIQSMPNVKYIGANAFTYCQGLTGFDIPDGVTEICEGTFNGCENLSAVDIPASVTKIGDEAFIRCQSLKSINLPDAITYIGDAAFYQCVNLKSPVLGLKLPSHLKVIGDMAFGYTPIERIIFPSSIEVIGDYAFEGCRWLEGDITLPLTMKELGVSPFMGTLVNTVNYQGDVTSWCENIIFGDKWSVTKDDGTPENLVLWFNSSWSRPLHIPDDVEFISPYAFCHIKNLNGIVLPGTLESIGEGAFDNENLTEIHTWHLSPLLIDESVFSSVDKSNCILYVPAGKKNVYQMADVWSSFVNIKEEGLGLDFDSLTIVEGDNVKLNVLALDGRQDLVWQSSDDSVVKVSNDGTITAVSSGEAKISVTSSYITRYTVQCVVTVVPKTVSFEIEEKELTMMDGEEKQIRVTVIPSNATNVFTWESKNTDVAVVDTAGFVTAVGVGTTTIKATSTDGTNLSDSCKITVLPVLASSVSINKGNVKLRKNGSLKLEAVVMPENANNKNVVWKSLDDDIVAIDDNGVIEGLKVGEGKVVVLTTDGSDLSDTCIVTVEPILVSSIEMSKRSLTLYKGETVVLDVAIMPEDADDKTIKWKSSNENIIQVDVNGRVEAVSVGKTSVVATTNDGSNLSATCEITVELEKASIVWNQEFEVVVGSGVNLEAKASNDAPVSFRVVRPNGGYIAPQITETDDVWTVEFPTTGAVVLEAFIEDENIDCEPVRKVFNVLPDRDVLLIDGIYYRYTDDSKSALSVAYGYSQYGGDVVVPSTANGVSVVSVGNRAFYSNAGLTSVTLPEGLERIESDQAFGNCPNLMKVVLPSTLIYIGSFTFNLDKGLKDIYCSMQDPSRVEIYGGEEIFNGFVDYETCILHVPYGCAQAYREAEVWKNFKNIVEGEKVSLPVTSIQFEQEKIVLTEGDTETLKVTVLPDDADSKDVAWSSSDNSVVTVNEDGVVTAVSGGTATITAAAVDGSGVKATCIVEVTFKGDSNNDGSVTVTDAVNTANYAVGKQVEAFAVKAADVNNDDIITMGDASGTISIVLEQPVVESGTLTMAAARAARAVGDRLVAEDYSLRQGGTGVVDVTLDNLTDYVALQADIVMPDGLTLEGVRLGPRAEATHTLSMRNVADGVTRVVVFSAANKAFIANGEPLLKLDVKAENANTDDITLRRILAADAEANEYELSYSGGHNALTSGIGGVGDGGVSVKPSPGGLHISNAKGMAVSVYHFDGSLCASFEARSDDERLSLPSGVYIVKVGSKATKVVVK